MAGFAVSADNEEGEGEGSATSFALLRRLEGGASALSCEDEEGEARFDPTATDVSSAAEAEASSCWRTEEAVEERRSAKRLKAVRALRSLTSSRARRAVSLSLRVSVESLRESLSLARALGSFLLSNPRRFVAISSSKASDSLSWTRDGSGRDANCDAIDCSAFSADVSPALSAWLFASATEDEEEEEEDRERAERGGRRSIIQEATSEGVDSVDPSCERRRKKDRNDGQKEVSRRFRRWRKMRSRRDF